MMIQEIAERVNTGDLPPDSPQSAPEGAAPLPQVYEFAMAAVAAQRVGSSTPTTVAEDIVTTKKNGATELAAYMYLPLIIVSIAAAALNVQTV